MNQFDDVVKGGGGVAGLIGLLLALRYYIPKWHNRASSKDGITKEELDRVITNAVEQRLANEMRNQKTIREIANEVRDDKMMDCLSRMEQFQIAMAKEMAGMITEIGKENMAMLRNMRDILRDVAATRGVRVRYYEDDPS